MTDTCNACNCWQCLFQACPYQNGCLLDKIPVVIFIKDTENRFVKVNQTFELEIGLLKVEVEGKTCSEIWSEKKGRQFWNDDLEVIKTKKSKQGIEERVTVRGEKRWFLTEKHPVFDEEGAVKGIMGITFDIHNQKLASHKLTTLETAIEQSPSIVDITDEKGRITYANPKFQQITGYSSKEVLGKNPRFLQSKKIPQSEYKKMWDILVAGETWRGEFLNRTKSGQLIWELASISPVKNKRGETTSYIKVAEVISNLHHTVLNLWNVLDYSQYFAVILDKDMNIKMSNRVLSKELGYDEIEIVGKAWREFVPGTLYEAVLDTHKQILEGNLGYREFTSELLTKKSGQLTVKWFLSFVNDETQWIFSIGIPIRTTTDKIDLEDNTGESVRRFFMDILAKDKTTIKALKAATLKESDNVV